MYWNRNIISAVNSYQTDSRNTIEREIVIRFEIRIANPNIGNLIS
jgi:hypothetical protein